MATNVSDSKAPENREDHWWLENVLFCQKRSLKVMHAGARDLSNLLNRYVKIHVKVNFIRPANKDFFGTCLRDGTQIRVKFANADTGELVFMGICEIIGLVCNENSIQEIKSFKLIAVPSRESLSLTRATLQDVTV